MKNSSFTPELLIAWFLKDFWKIAISFVVFAALSIWIAINIPNEYTSSTKVASNFNEQSGAGALSRLGGLASLAGISVGKSNYSPEVLREMISANSFLASFIKEQNIGAIIMAAEGFNPSSGEFIYNEKLYDAENAKWVREFKYPQSLEPADAELVKEFKDSFSISYDRKTELIQISFTSYSPAFAKALLENLVYSFNEFMRAQEIENNTQSLAFLKSELTNAGFSEVKMSLQQIMEEQYKNLALAKTRKEFAFKTIEAPLLPILKSAPKRAVICLAITLAGTIFTILMLFTFRLYRHTRT
jgi:uncharacterized protein involved in exopolysaccharide biosynthesis